MPCCRDESAKYTAGLAEYQRNGWGDRVLYKCDRITPAWTTYEGESFNKTALLPLDITNPAVLDWQIETYVKPFVEKGFDALAVDNYNLENSWRACGIWRNSSNGTATWVKLFAGTRPHDAAWQQATISWLERMKARVNALTTRRGGKMLIIPNWGPNGLGWNNSVVERVGNASDGILSEMGITGMGPRNGRPYGFVGKAWVQRIEFMRNLQAHGRAAFFIDQYGDVDNVSNWKTPCAAEPRNCITKAVRQWCLASYLMGRGDSAALFLSGIQHYGFLSWYPEWGTANAIGRALQPPQQQQAPGG